MAQTSSSFIILGWFHAKKSIMAQKSENVIFMQSNWISHHGETGEKFSKLSIRGRTALSALSKFPLLSIYRFSFTIFVGLAIVEPRVQIISPIKNQIIKSNQSVLFNCTVSLEKNVSGTIQWSKDGFFIPPNKKSQHWASFERGKYASDFLSKKAKRVLETLIWSSNT